MSKPPATHEPPATPNPPATTTYAGVGKAALALAGRAGCLLGAGVAFGLVLNVIHPRGVSLTAAAPGAAACTAPADDAPAVAVLPPEQAVTLCGQADVLVADARSADEFARGHIAGAVHLPCAASQGTAEAVLARLARHPSRAGHATDPDAVHTVVVYGHDTGDALAVANEIRRRIDRPEFRITVIAGGFAAWDRAGLACSSGPCPDCRPAEAR